MTVGLFLHDNLDLLALLRLHRGGGCVKWELLQLRASRGVERSAAVVVIVT